MVTTSAEPSFHDHSETNDDTTTADASQEDPVPDTPTTARQPLCEACEPPSETPAPQCEKRRDYILCLHCSYLYFFFCTLPILLFWVFKWLGFYDGRKRRRSTMPWDIPPPLAVLWGVCWMFYGQGSDPRRMPQCAYGEDPTVSSPGL